MNANRYKQANNDDIPVTAKLLQNETVFSRYLDLLKKFVPEYLVVILSYDTPWGPSFTQELTQKLRALGCNVDLYGKMHRSYAAIIDKGELVFEELSATVQGVVKCETNLDDTKIELVATSFTSDFKAAGLSFQSGLIKIGGSDYFNKKRGLSILVYDRKRRVVLDNVTFDTYSEDISAYRLSTYSDALHSFQKHHPDVSLVLFNMPSFPPEAVQTKNERFIYSNNLNFHTILQNLDRPLFAIQKYYAADAIKEVLSIPKSYHDINGIRRFEEYSSKYVNIVGGHRVTEFQPQKRGRTVYLIGGCGIFGIGAEDKYTIASFLQQLLNTTLHEQTFTVQNYGFFLADTDARSYEELDILHSVPVKPGDIVLMAMPSLLFSEFSHIDIAQSSLEPRSHEIFFDFGHFTPHGYLLIAQKLFEGLSERGLLSSASESHVVSSAVGDYNLSSEENQELSEYKNVLVDFYKQHIEVSVGAIVMNCNPFTLGHRYLIEQALRQCHYLAIFVVQEDYSVFPFDDRMDLIEAGTKDLEERIILIPSGRFIISSLTFSEYFNKSELQERTIDTSMDVTLFAREIAPCMHITKRFVGEEPFDRVTKQYNETMKRVLPEYGIELVEIPRKEFDGQAISASRVRELLNQGDFDSIRSLVPETTFNYLSERFSF